ncbi:MAG: hypothetical protein Q8W46_02765 [Candidatus Palauibacterales bacterium]|nr:hypothetical protein [Candidatus Palauibacterales bacterium]
MPHISDGDLHAMVDGAFGAESEELQTLQEHLDSCASCSVRLEEARQLRSDAEDILGLAAPSVTAPSFADVRKRAGERMGSGSSGAPRSERLRRGWISAQRLGWAASVLLALGAGWMGRAVLVERGWTDPFHPGSMPTAEAVSQEADQEAQAELSGRDADVTESEVGDEADRRRQEIAAGEPDDLMAQAANEREAARRKADLADREGMAPAPRTEVLAEAPPQPLPESEEAGKADAAAERADFPSAPEDQAELQGKAVQPPLDPWHALPAGRLENAQSAAVGCYRLEYSWSPGVAHVPGRIELSATPAGSAGDPSIGSVYALSDAVRAFGESTWAAPSPDSIWVRIVTRPDRDMFTIRAERTGPDWLGEGRILSAAAPVSNRGTRGTVRLVRFPCPQ